MRQSWKRLERLQHRRCRQAHGFAQAQGGQRIGGIVHAGDFHACNIEQLLAASRQENPRTAADQREIGIGVPNGKGQGARGRVAIARIAHRHDPGIIRVQHHGGRIGKDSALGLRVRLDGGVAVQVIGRDVEHHGGLQHQRGGRFQLKARQFEHVQIRFRSFEQIERRLAEIAAGQDLPARGRRHARHQGGHGALAIGAGDADHRGTHCARE